MPAFAVIVSSNIIACTVILRLGSRPAPDITTLSPLMAAVNVARVLLPLLTTLYVVINAFVPSCTTNPSMFVTSVFESLFTDINSFAPLKSAWAKLVIASEAESTSVVSYTHLTLPTMDSV